MKMRLVLLTVIFLTINSLTILAVAYLLTLLFHLSGRQLGYTDAVIMVTVFFIVLAIFHHLAVKDSYD